VGVGADPVCVHRSDDGCGVNTPVIQQAVLVTGAGGFIGREVVRRLAREPGVVVRGGTRDGRPIGPGVASCRMDVREAAEVAEALRGIDAVVHCAVGNSTTTVEGTSTLLQLAARAGVRRIVHFSSVAVYGTTPGEVHEASALVAAKGRGYAHWKVAAEVACHAAANERMDVVMLRPAIVYGPGGGWLTQPARRLLSGVWGGLGTLGQGTCNPVHVSDVAEACLVAIRMSGFAGCEAFNISGPEVLTWNAWHERLAALLGCPPPPLVSPASWRRRSLFGLPFKALRRLLPAAGKLFERQILAAPSSTELALFALAATYPTAKAAASLGWRPQVGLEDGLAGSVAWLRASGLIPAAHATREL
jgi:nucleoside-diphosphate-sugar epimerase